MWGGQWDFVWAAYALTFILSALVLRIFKNLLGRSFLKHISAVHKQYAIPDFTGKPHLVGNHHHGHPVHRELFHNIQHLAHHFRVQCAGWFVKQHHIRVHGQCAHNGNALLLSPGELFG